MSAPSDSPVVAKTVRAVAPFALTFGLFTTFHGTKSAGGGFQGGVVAASVVVTLAFAFGVEQTRAALGRRLLVGVAAAGLLAFGLVAAGTTLSSGEFLSPTRYPVEPAYPVEIIELAIGATVTSIASLLFFELAGTEGSNDR